MSAVLHVYPVHSGSTHTSHVNVTVERNGQTTELFTMKRDALFNALFAGGARQNYDDVIIHSRVQHAQA